MIRAIKLRLRARRFGRPQHRVLGRVVEVTGPQQFPWCAEASEEARLNIAMTVDILQRVPEDRRPTPESIAVMFSDRQKLTPEEHVVALCSTIGHLFRMVADQ